MTWMTEKLRTFTNISALIWLFVWINTNSCRFEDYLARGETEHLLCLCCFFFFFKSEFISAERKSWKLIKRTLCVSRSAWTSCLLKLLVWCCFKGRPSSSSSASSSSSVVMCLQSLPVSVTSGGGVRVCGCAPTNSFKRL